MQKCCIVTGIAVRKRGEQLATTGSSNRETENGSIGEPGSVVGDRLTRLV